MNIIGNIRVGKPDVAPDTPSHTSGVKQGNDPERRQAGIRFVGAGAKGTAARSTGINAKHKNPIDARMPNLSPP